MKLQIIKSKEEIEIIKHGARIADIGGGKLLKHQGGKYRIGDCYCWTKQDGERDCKTYPDAEYMDTWVWFQSRINTDGAHNPKTNRKLKNGDILSLNTFQ